MSDQKRLLSLPAPDSSPNPESMIERPVVYQAQAQAEAADTEPEAVPLSHYLWLLNREKWKVLAFVFVAVAGTIIVSSRLTPYYQSTATLDIDRMAPTEVIGQQSSSRAGNDSEQFLSTQVKLIESDSVLRPVVQRFQLAKVAGGKVPSARSGDAPVSLGRLSVTRPPKTYLIQISYRSPDPVLAADVANAVARSY